MKVLGQFIYFQGYCVKLDEIYAIRLSHAPMSVVICMSVPAGSFLSLIDDRVRFVSINDPGQTQENIGRVPNHNSIYAYLGIKEVDPEFQEFKLFFNLA